MDKKNIIIAAVLFVAFVGGLIWLAGQDAETNGQDVDDQFAAYATELGLDTEQFRADMASDGVKEKIAQDMAAGRAVGLSGTPTIAINGAKIDSPRSSEALLALLEQSEGSEDKEVIRENDQVKGNSDGDVTITEYSDFQCPACGAYTPILRNTLEKTDSVRFIYRHFPLDGPHKNARGAAQAAEAAGKQGKFWEMHDLLFDRQKQWSNL